MSLSRPTVYQNRNFYSQLEAKWAYYFDLMGIRWQYDHQGFVLPGNEKHGPKFWLPELQQFVEVKPTSFDCSWREPRYDFYDHGATVITGNENLDLLIVPIGERQSLAPALCIAIGEIAGKGVPTYIEFADIEDAHRYADEIHELTSVKVTTRDGALQLWYATHPKPNVIEDMYCCEAIEVAFRIVMGDPRERKTLANAHAAQLPYDQKLALAARNHKFGGTA